MSKVKCAIIGSGNIGTDLMLKIIKTSQSLSLNGVIGIDPESEGLAMAKSHNIPISNSGLQGFMEMDEYQDTGGLGGGIAKNEKEYLRIIPLVIIFLLKFK